MASVVSDKLSLMTAGPHWIRTYWSTVIGDNRVLPIRSILICRSCCLQRALQMPQPTRSCWIQFDELEFLFDWKR